MRRLTQGSGVLRADREPGKSVTVTVTDDMVKVALRCFGSERFILLTGIETLALSRLLAMASAHALSGAVSTQKEGTADVEAT